MICECCRCNLWEAQEKEGKNQNHCDACIELEEYTEEDEGFLSKCWRFIKDES